MNVLLSPLFIQLIGVGAIISIIWSFQQKKRSAILFFLSIGQVLFSIHYGLLGAWTAVAINVIGIVRGIVFYYKPRYHWAQQPIWAVLFIVAFWIGGFMTWAGWHSVLPLLAMTIETIGVWRNDPKQMRWFLLATRPLFFAYSLIVGSYAGMVADVVFSISIITGMVRFDRNSKNEYTR